MVDDIEDIIRQLEELRIERSRISDRERQLLSQLAITTGRTTTNRVTPTEIENDTDSSIFYVGQRVYIQNRIRHVPFSRRATPKDRAGIVSRIQDERIYLTTYNGYSTWRNRDNLRHLTDREHDTINST